MARLDAFEETPEQRPFSRDELQAFFDRAAGRVARRPPAGARARS